MGNPLELPIYKGSRTDYQCDLVLQAYFAKSFIWVPAGERTASTGVAGGKQCYFGAEDGSKTETKAERWAHFCLLRNTSRLEFLDLEEIFIFSAPTGGGSNPEYF